MKILYRLSVSKIKYNQCNIIKIRNLVNSYVFRTIYFAVFESNLNYCSLAWSQDFNAINRLVILQKKLLELWTFSYVVFTLVFYSKKVSFLNSQLKLIWKRLYLLVNPSTIFYLLFSMTDFYFGLTMAIFISPFTKLIFMARIPSL